MIFYIVEFSPSDYTIELVADTDPELGVAYGIYV